MRGVEERAEGGNRSDLSCADGKTRGKNDDRNGEFEAGLQIAMIEVPRVYPAPRNWTSAGSAYIRRHCGMIDDERWMREALTLAREAATARDVPVGAIVVQGDTAIARASNRTVRDQDPTGHAELLAIREASRVVGDWRLTGCSLFVTLEPCAMCAGAIVLARLDRVVFGAFDDKAGMAGSVGDLLRHSKLNHRPQVRASVLAAETGAILSEFFRTRR